MVTKMVKKYTSVEIQIQISYEGVAVAIVRVETIAEA